MWITVQYIKLVGNDVEKLLSWRDTALKMFSKCSFIAHINSAFSDILPRLQDVGEGREQDAEALSRTHLSIFQKYVCLCNGLAVYSP
jgi:hypothetical protein